MAVVPASSGAPTAPDLVALVSRTEVDGSSWEVELLPARLADDLDDLVAALRQSGGGRDALGLVNLEDEVAVLVRVGAGGAGSPVRLLLSDVTAAWAYDLARDIVEALDVEVPDEDDLDEVWPVGDLSMLSDLGADEMQVGAVLSDTDAYAGELLDRLARLAGFGPQWGRVVERTAR